MSEPLDKFHEHEAFDRAFVILDAWGSYVTEHPYVAQNPALEEMAREASAKMFDVYQEIARLSGMLDEY